MSTYYLIAIIILFGIAIFDLMAGVANDAVNFLNSAIGSKVAAFKTILIVASIGIVFGAFFSGGMMEIAKSGVFNPEKLTFADVMIIFLAVMLTDVILLDTFNTFGIPTSTTVSLVFALLGAAVAVSLWNILGAGSSLAEMSNYINTAKALAIVSSILLSVGIAFSAGVFCQYVSRLLFSFHYEKRLKWFGALWCGASITAMVYFLLVKGLKGAAFVPHWVAESVNEHAFIALIVMFIGSAIFAQAVISLGLNILKFTVLFGTMSLAMAFASNDLVNFIGVPVAGLESYRAWVASGLPADKFTMESLLNPVPSSSYILLASGVIMALVLWLSKKARTVTATELSLSRQDSGEERFAASGLARLIVVGARRVSGTVATWIPAKWWEFSAPSFEKPSVEATRAASSIPSDNGGSTNGSVSDEAQPAFDLIRATVNLTAASSLIALATSQKLPLSTTYVTFLVAMGSSLADRAWDRDTAVYRVSGVLNIVGCWFLTAFVAFSMAAIFASVVYFGGPFGLALLLAGGGYALWHSYQLHRLRETDKKKASESVASMKLGLRNTLDTSLEDAVEFLLTIRDIYNSAIHGFVDEDFARLRRARNKLASVEKMNERRRVVLHHLLVHSEEANLKSNRRILKFFDLAHDILLSLGALVERCTDHVLNSHRPPSAEQCNALRLLAGSIDHYLSEVETVIGQRLITTNTDIQSKKLALYALIEELLVRHLESAKEDPHIVKNNEIVLRVLLESKDVVAISARFLKHYEKRLWKLLNPTTTQHADRSPP